MTPINKLISLALSVALILTLGFSDHAQAVLNPNVLAQNLPDASCKIVYPMDNGHEGVCSGTLISKQLVLTALHCEQEGVIVSTAKIKVTCGRTAETRIVSDRVRNPSFDEKGVFYGTYDVAVLKVDQPFSFDPVELPASENDLNDLLVNGYCGDFGYGMDSIGVSQGGIGPLTTHVEDNKDRAGTGIPFPETRIKFQSFAPNFGDSGGGVLCRRMRRDWKDRFHKVPVGNWIIVGFNSHDFEGNSLAPDLDWVKEQIPEDLE